jgi:hypothetical protein
MREVLKPTIKTGAIVVAAGGYPTAGAGMLPPFTSRLRNRRFGRWA